MHAQSYLQRQQEQQQIKIVCAELKCSFPLHALLLIHPSIASGDESLPDSQPSSASVTENLERRMHRLEEQCSSIQKSMDEVQSMVSKLSQDSFKIKGSQYEVRCVICIA